MEETSGQILLEINEFMLPNYHYIERTPQKNNQAAILSNNRDGMEDYLYSSAGVSK